MTRRFGVLAAAALCSLTLACGGSGSESTTAAPAKTDAAAAKTDTSHATVAASDFGVPECDDYMKKYVACVDSHAPDASRQGLRQALEQTKAAWKQAAATPQGKAALATGCTQALATAKTSFAAFGCQW